MTPILFDPDFISCARVRWPSDRAAKKSEERIAEKQERPRLFSAIKRSWALAPILPIFRFRVFPILERFFVYFFESSIVFDSPNFDGRSNVSG